MSSPVYSHGRPSVRGTGGMVASAHPLASLAGINMLQAGGNAFDAIAATAASLNVVEPYMSGLAGLGMATIYTAADDQIRTLDFHPPVPAAFDASTLSRAETMDGPNASGVPGNLAGWCFLVETLGQLPLEQIFAPAINQARNGYPTSAFFQEMTAVGKTRQMQPEWQETYVDPSDGGQIGAVIKQPALAKTLEDIAVKGPQHLFGGALGQQMVDHIQKLGGCLSMADLEAVAAIWEVPITARFGALEVNVPPPPAESFQIPLTLRILDGLDLAAAGHLSADHLDPVLRAIRLAAEVRIQNNRCRSERVAELLEESHIALLRAQVMSGAPIIGRTEQFGDAPSPAVRAAREHTTSFSAVDAAGNMVCLTQSLGSMYGSGVVIPGTGVCMNNFMNWGDINPASPNYLRGGERFGMCLAPSISRQNGEAVLALGTPGSYGILQTQVQALVHHQVYGLDLQAAIDAPRVRLWDHRRVDVEARVEADVLAELTARGHDVHSCEAFSMSCGGMQAIARNPANGALTGAADSRRDGAAIGI